MKSIPSLRAIAATVLLLTPLLCAKAQEAPPLPVATPDQAGFSEAGLARIETFFDNEIKQDRVPGAVVGIVRDGKLVYYKAFGYLDKDMGKPMPLNAIFSLASMTKIMVAVGALSLTQEGRLPLHNSLANYYPQFASMNVAVKRADDSIDYEPQQHPITIQDLMRHTSGLTYPGRSDSSSPAAVTDLYPTGPVLAKMTTAEYISTITKLPLVHQPGTVFEYSQSFEVLGAVVEKISGQSLGGYLNDVIWQPLDMKDTSFHITDDMRERVAQAFKLNPLDGKPQEVWVTAMDPTFECGGGCSVGTVGDYLRFGQMLLNGGELEGHRVLSPQMVQLMTSNHLNKNIVNRVADYESHRNGYGFGLSVAVRMDPGLAAVPGNVGEYSWNGANGTGFFVDPQAKLVVVFATAAPGEIRKYYREQVQDLVYGAMTR